MAGTSFSIMGATPASTAPVNFGAYSSAPVSTPQQKALNSASSPTGSAAIASAFPMQSAQATAAKNPVTSLVNPNAGLQTAGLLSSTAAQPSTAVKSVSDTAGNTVTYHPPTTQSSVTSPQTTSTSSQTNIAPSYSPTDPGLLGGITTGLANTATAGSPQATGLIGSAQTASQGAIAQYSPQEQQAFDAAQQYNKQLQDLRSGYSNEFSNIQGSGIPLEFQQGREQVLQNQYANLAAGYGQALSGESALANTSEAGQTAGISSLNTAAGNANTAQGQTLSGLANAGQLASPIQAPYSNQVLSPVTGQSIQGGSSSGSSSSSLPAAALTFINSLAQQVQNGQMTRDAATSQLSAYGLPGLQALNTALGSNFNTNASNASAATTAQGQQLQTQAATVNKALDTLGQLFQQLPSLETGGIPATNAIANWIGTNLGQQSLTAFKTNLADARSQLVGVLNAAGGTPTGNEATALQYLPDNMTVAQFQQNVGTQQNPGIVRQLVAQKVSQFVGSGQQTSSPTGGATGNSLYSF